MSPRVTLEIAAGELVAMLKPARAHLLEAVAAARARGVWMRCGAIGVVPGLTEWRVDRRLNPVGVSLVGAVLLHLQPEPEGSEDPLAAAARALGMSLAWVEGAEAAFCCELMGIEWLARQDADLYLDGYEAGAATRLAMETRSR